MATATADQSSSQVPNDQELSNAKLKLVLRWHEICDSGHYPIVYSFLTISKNREEFGILSLPDEFVKNFGDMLPFMIGLRCDKTLWCVNYDLERKEIYGLGKLMKFYGLKILNLVQIDYYGEGIFKLKIFKDTTMECTYPLGSANAVEISTEWEELNRSHYVVDTGSLPFGKALTSISFNASSNRNEYSAMLFLDSDIDHSRRKMMLTPMWEDLYNHWTNGSIVSLKFLDKTWGIKIKKRGEACYLGRGWLEFVADVGLRDSDYLLAYREDGDEDQCLRVCICSAADHGLELISVLTEANRGGWSKSFFKIVTKHVTERRMFVVPFLIKELYGWKLSQIKTISIAGLDWGFFYNNNLGRVYNLDDIVIRFGLKVNDTLVLTINEIDVIYGRIYQSDGSEINYTVGLNRELGDTPSDWLWSILNNSINEDSDSSGTEAPVQMGDGAMAAQHFSTTMSAGNVDKKTHGLFIPLTVNPASDTWIRGQKIRFITRKGVWNIGITTTGKRPRFSAGWNAFIRDNEYTAGQRLNFRMVEHDGLIDFDITEI